MSSYREEILKQIEETEDELLIIEVDHEARIKETKEDLENSQRELHLCDFFESKRVVNSYEWVWIEDTYHLVTVFYGGDELPLMECFVVDYSKKKPKPVRLATVVKKHFNKGKK